MNSKESRVEFFAAHAPEKIPEWFSHKSSIRAIRPNTKISNPKLQHQCDAWRMGTIESLISFSDTNPKDRKLLKAYEAEWKAYFGLLKEQMKSRREERYFAWRKHYGEMMAALLTPTEPRPRADDVSQFRYLIAKGIEYRKAIRAILALVDGDFDNLTLIKYGPLSPDIRVDIGRIAQAALKA